MNYYNPYFGSISYTPVLGNISTQSTSKGLLSSLFGGGKISSFINSTQKTLGIINQAIPLVKQVSPVIKNAKTMFKVMNEFKKVDNSTSNQNSLTSQNSSHDYIDNINTTDVENNINQHISSNNGPTFFL